MAVFPKSANKDTLPVYNMPFESQEFTSAATCMKDVHILREIALKWENE